MDVVNIVTSIAIGLITGALSSWYVSSKFEKRSIEAEQKREFEEDKQQLHNFLMHIFDELILVEDSLDTSRLVWIIGSKPFCNRLNAQKNDLDPEDNKMLERIDEIVEDIREFCFIRDRAIVFSDREKKEIFSWTNEIPAIARKVKFISNPKIDK